MKFFRDKKLNKGFTPTPFNKKGVSLQSKRGFTLVETLVAISIFSVSVIALMSFLAQGVSNTGYAKAKVTAGYLAQEGIEYIRNMRDSYVAYSDITSNNWNSFKVQLAPCNLGNECGFDNSLSVDNPNFIFKCTTHTNGCNLYVNNGNYNTNSSGVDSYFVRNFYIENINQDEVKVYSHVYWDYKGKPYSITITEVLFNWIEI